MAQMTAVSAATLPAKASSAANGAAESHAEKTAGRGAYLTDDEILGLVSDAMARDRDHARGADEEAARIARSRKNANVAGLAENEGGANEAQGEDEANGMSDARDEDSQAVNTEPDGVPENLRAAFDENPELRQAWQDARDYRKSFATPQEAREATAMLGDLNRLDALFFSRRPEDHAQLARTVAQLDPAAFASLAHAMAEVAAKDGAGATTRGAASGGFAAHAAPQNAARQNSATNSFAAADETASRDAAASSTTNEHAAGGPTAAQTEFFQSANASAVEGVLEAIESQLDRLLPENMPARARTRVAGEVYRELDAELRGNRQFGEQMRRAFRSGGLDAGHERAIVSLVTRQARQALPGVAKRVLNEWTSALVTANAQRRERQKSAESRVDIAGTGGSGREGRRTASPREIDYARMSDADILNL